MRTFNLIPVNGRKSFGGKAVVKEWLAVSTLFSYGLDVAQFDHHNNKMKVYAYHSATTMTHINAFLDYYGFDICTKKELEKNYLNK